MFFCRKWLADDEGDRLIERDLVEDIDYRKQRESSKDLLSNDYFKIIASRNLNSYLLYQINQVSGNSGLAFNICIDFINSDSQHFS